MFILFLPRRNIIPWSTLTKVEKYLLCKTMDTIDQFSQIVKLKLCVYRFGSSIHGAIKMSLSLHDWLEVCPNNMSDHSLPKIYNSCSFLPPANEVWGTVIFLHLSVILFTGGWWYPSMHCRWYPSMPCSRSPGGSIPACLAGFQAQTQGRSLGGSGGGWG